MIGAERKSLKSHADCIRTAGPYLRRVRKLFGRFMSLVLVAIVIQRSNAAEYGKAPTPDSLPANQPR